MATLTGSAGNDTLTGGPGDDLFTGGTGADRFVLAGAGNSDWGHDRITDFEVGTDKIDLTGTDLHYYDLTLTAVDGGTLIEDGLGNSLTVDGRAPDELDADQFLFATSSYVGGTDSPDRLLGNAGNNEILAMAGNDTIIAGAGHDTVLGNSGHDQIWAGAGDEGRDVFAGGQGNDSIGGGAGDDLLIGGNMGSVNYSAGSDRLYGGLGDDTVIAGHWLDKDGDGRFDADEAYAGDRASALWGGQGDDLLVGSVGGDTLGGGAGADTLLAGAGNDVIYASLGNDSIDAGAGDDTLWGGKGDDTMTGGAGADVFMFGRQSGHDTVTDFNADEDVLDLTAAGFADMDALLAASHMDGNDLVISSGTMEIRLLDTGLDALTLDAVLL